MAAIFDFEQELERQRQESFRKMLAELFGAKAEITVRKEKKPTDAFVQTVTGSKVAITAEKIRLSRSDEQTMIASVQLAGSKWNKVRASGPKEFQMKSVAIGLALGISVTAKDQASFTKADRQRIFDYAASLDFASVRPGSEWRVKAPPEPRVA